MSKNFFSTISFTSKNLYPKSKLIYLVSGVYLLTILNNESENPKISSIFFKQF